MGLARAPGTSRPFPSMASEPGSSPFPWVSMNEGRKPDGAMTRINCWEFTGCGREPGGARVEALGVCPAALPGAWAGQNRGQDRGRICWVVAGTLCGGEVQGPPARKLKACLKCAFLRAVQEQEGRSFVLLPRRRPSQTV